MKDDVSAIYIVCRGKRWDIEGRPPEAGTFMKEYKLVNGSAAQGRNYARKLVCSLQGTLPTRAYLPESLIR